MVDRMERAFEHALGHQMISTASLLAVRGDQTALPPLKADTRPLFYAGTK